MDKGKAVLCCVLLSSLAGLAVGAPKKPKREQDPCSKPPELLSKRPLPKEEQEHTKKIRAQGEFAIVISEEGKVVDRKPVRVTSEEAGVILTDLVNGMQFKPRPGCGAFKTTVAFNLAND